MRAPPNATYYVAIACQRYVGSLTTDGSGNGSASIDAGTATGTFYIDMGVGGGSQSDTSGYVIAGPVVVS